MTVFSEMFPVLVKQRSNLLLVHDRGWVNNRSLGRVTYSSIDELRRQLGAEPREPRKLLEILAPLSRYDGYDFEMLSRLFPVTGLVPMAQPGLIVFDGEREKARKALLSAEGIRIADLSIRTRQRLAQLQGGQWRGSALALDPIARIRLEAHVSAAEVLVGYTVTAGTRKEPALAVFRPSRATDPIFVTPLVDDPED